MSGERSVDRRSSPPSLSTQRWSRKSGPRVHPPAPADADKTASKAAIKYFGAGFMAVGRKNAPDRSWRNASGPSPGKTGPGASNSGGLPKKALAAFGWRMGILTYGSPVH